MSTDKSDPVILCHAACSGGSMIYRMMIATFSLTGVSEVSHCFHFESNDFTPTDPELSLKRAGVISESEFSEIFLKRIGNACEICSDRGNRLLIREHTHSYFFYPTPESGVPAYPSWIAERHFERTGRALKCIVTVRDPIDSWLGLLASFPESASADFSEYCDRYATFVGACNNVERESLILIRYEDIIEDPISQLRRMANFIDAPIPESLPQEWNKVHSSGSSGRQSGKIERRPRRPFGARLLREAALSDSYRYLTEKFSYPHICESITARDRVRLWRVDLKSRVARYLFSSLKPLRDRIVRGSRIP